MSTETDKRRLVAEQLRIWSRCGLTHLPRPRPAPRTEESPPVPVADNPPTADETPAVPASPSAPWADLSACREDALACNRCALAETRQKVVFGDGDEAAELMFVGEAPGAEEDRRGLPFVGRAGKLLDKMIDAMGLARERVYIANVLKCRPTGNRDPLPDEVTACRPFLDYQIDAIRPKIICCLGRHAAMRLLDTDSSLKNLRGRFHPHNEDTRVAVTYHPAYCLRNPAAKRNVWEDLQLIMAELDLTPPA